MNPGVFRRQPPWLLLSWEGMKFVPLLSLALAGCTLYFGPGSSSSDDSPPIGPLPKPQPSDPKPGDPPNGIPPDPTDPGGGPLPARCGSPEVHVFGVYETRGDHGPNNHPVGQADVGIERPGDHVLVLSAYEPTNWHVHLGVGATVRAVQLLGYYTQTVDLPGVPVTHGTACGYSYPYNGGGCDTNELLALAKTQAGADITSFHGCYQASGWKLFPNGTVTSDCNTAAGYRVAELFGACRRPSGWERFNFATLEAPACTGARYIRHDDHYNVWVGAILCGSSRSYKLYMSDSRDTSFLQIADYAGHGQDHCELVNPAFTIPDEDDIQSGGCTDCSVGQLIDPIDVPVYARAKFGEPFQRVTSRYWADLSTTAYSCGVAIP